jgi:uncharacterized protein YecE (DUF72 family)
MLLEPIKITLYDPKTQEPLKEYCQRVITFAMLSAAVQLQEALGDLPEKQRRWWWQKPISKESQQIDALMELVASFFGDQFTVQELRTGADVSEVMSVLQAIVARAGAIVTANPTVPPASRKRH